MLFKKIAILCTTLLSPCNAQQIGGTTSAPQAQILMAEQEFTLITEDTAQMMNTADSEYFNLFVNKMNDAIVEVIKEFQLVEEIGGLFEFLTSDEWLEVIETGTNQQVIDAFGDGIDPLSNKLLGVYGPDMAINMPIEMIQWIRDSSILFIKYKGAGQATTEDAVREQNQVQFLNNQMEEMRDFYDQQVANFQANISELRNQIDDHKREILAQNDRVAYLQNQVDNQSNSHEASIQDVIDQHQEEKNYLNNQHQQEIQKTIANSQQQCNEQKRQILKSLNSKYTESTVKLTDELITTWQEKLDYATMVNGGIRMDLEKDQESGKYKITDIVKTDPSYDLNGLIFKFTRADQTNVHYFIDHLTKDQFCAMDDEQIVQKEQFCDSDSWRDQDGNPCVPTLNFMSGRGEEPEPEQLEFSFHDLKEFSDTCQDSVQNARKCGQCNVNQMWDKKHNKHSCPSDHFCFTFDDKPHCSNCTLFGQGCKSCSFHNKCLQCYTGYWLHHSICEPRPWYRPDW